MASSGGWPFVPHEVSESTAVPPDQFCDRCQQPNVKAGPSSFLMTERCSLMFRNCMSQEEKKGKKPALQFCELQKNCQVPGSQYSC